MAQTALARERLFALRETIARLEGRPAPALAPASGPTPVVPAPAGSDQPTERITGGRP